MLPIIAGAIVLAMVTSSCRVLVNPDPADPITSDGYVTPEWIKARQDGYLAFATTALSPGSATNVIAHAERSRRDPAFSFDAAAVTPAAFAGSFSKIDNFVDTADFDLLYLMNLWYGYRDLLSPELRAAIEQRMVAFKYWYTDPQPTGVIDERWYWSENHRLLFHAEEYLSGQAFPDIVFSNDGKTGSEHKQRAAAFIDAWLTEKTRFGFSEWHSDVYYQKTAVALLTIVEWIDDPVLMRRAEMVLDLLLFDMARHLQKGNFGATHGRSYMKDKSVATDQDTFGLAKLLFDDTSLPYVSTGDPGAALFARAQRYRMPTVLPRIAKFRGPTLDKERMGVPLDPSAPVSSNPEAPYGYNFTDPANVPFWWERGGQATWQNVEMTVDQLTRYGLWESAFFKPFKPLRDIVGEDMDLARVLAQSLAPMLGFGLLTEVNTVTYRTDTVMLSSANDYRPGMFGDQHHISQATLDEYAIVFTTHPKNEPVPYDQWRDGDGYWTGSGSLPRAAQQGSAVISLYTPAFAVPGPPLETFAYLNYTHAYFPQERFDEVVQAGNWTFGRKGDGYVALWSWRPVRWRTYEPSIFTHGLTEPFDLVAEGGADNVWITQVGDAPHFGDFAAFRDAILASPPAVTPLVSDGELPGGFEVEWASPVNGTLGFGTKSPFTVNGVPHSLTNLYRYDNVWSKTPWDAPRHSDRRRRWWNRPRLRRRHTYRNVQARATAQDNRRRRRNRSGGRIKTAPM